MRSSGVVPLSKGGKTRVVATIAEIGVNHNGSYSNACHLVDAAKDAGADYVKFQIFEAESLATKEAQAAAYQKKGNAISSLTQHELLQTLQLKHEDFCRLRERCQKVGVGFLATGFSEKDILFIDSLEPDFVKIPSGEINNLPLLEVAAGTSAPILLSTGMAYLHEVSAAVEFLESQKRKRSEITVLQCVSNYPAKIESYNLRAMVSMGQALGTEYGLSDHSLGSELSIAAVALGASIVEKHFTLNRNDNGPDHSASIEPAQFAIMVESLRGVSASLGDGVKRPMTEELENRSLVRRSIVARRNIEIGEIFSIENITTKRPGTGLSPSRWHETLGKTATRAYFKDEPL